MNRRPEIKGPDGKIIPLFSPQFENYLDQGYTIEYLINVLSLDMPILEISPNIPFTHIQDIDLNILNQLPIDQLKTMCNVNQYTKQLCQQDYFWKDKIVNENLFIPQPLNIKQIDWMKVYEAAYYTNDNINRLNKSKSIRLLPYTQYQGKEFLKFILEKTGVYNYVNDDELKIFNVILYKTILNSHQIEIRYYGPSVNDQVLNLTEEQAYNFIFYTLYYNVKD